MWGRPGLLGEVRKTVLDLRRAPVIQESQWNNSKGRGPAGPTAGMSHLGNGKSKCDLARVTALSSSFSNRQMSYFLNCVLMKSRSLSCFPAGRYCSCSHSALALISLLSPAQRY